VSKKKSPNTVPSAIEPAVPPVRLYETAEEIAERLSVESSTIYAWARRNLNPLPARRITKKVYRFVWSEVKAWVDAGGTLCRKKVA
jgi:excisionase family DNA binding protein